jgi:hypothetical protein
MKIGKEFGGGIARMQMWRGVKSAEEIAAMAKAAHSRVIVDEEANARVISRVDKKGTQPRSLPPGKRRSIVASH